MIKTIQNYSIILLLYTILFFPINSFSQDNTASFKSGLDSLISSDFFSRSQIAIDIYDLSNDQTVYSKNEKLLLHPASIEKILTTAAALKFLGPDYNFKTEVYHTGEVNDSTCTGDLYIVGGFDPCFSINDLDSTVREIKNYGINEIKGNCYADVSAGDSLFWGNGWMWDDDPGSYAAYISPLNIEENSIRIICSPGILNQPAVPRLEPANNFITLGNFSVTTDTGKTSLTVTRDWINRSNKIVIKGNINSASEPDTFTVNIYNPIKYFLDLTKEKFSQHGIKFSGKIDTLTLANNSDKIFSIDRNIDSVIVYTNKNSYNLGAEMLLRVMASENMTKPSTAKKGIEFVDSLISLSGFEPEDYRIVDGSGLSFYNLISAKLTTGLLKYLYFNEEDIFVKLYNSFPIAGYDGTLKERMKNTKAERSVHAKTGTLSGVSNIAGYLRTRTGKLLAFSVFIQNYSGSSNYAKSIEDKICELMEEL